MKPEMDNEKEWEEAGIMEESWWEAEYSRQSDIEDNSNVIPSEEY